MCVALLSGGSNRYKDHITEEPAKYVLLPILQIRRENARFNTSIYCARLLLIFTCSSVIYSYSKFSFNPIFLNFKNSLHLKSSDIFLSHPDFLALFPCPSLLALSSVEQLSPRSCSHSLQEPQERLLGAHPQCVNVSRFLDGFPAASVCRLVSMKSGPTLNVWTSYPRRRNAEISPTVSVVFPTPLCVPATTKAELFCFMITLPCLIYRKVFIMIETIE